jgi:predicted Zn-dependent peptidase
MIAAVAGVLAAQDIKEFEKKVTEFVLPNGLHFLIVERHDAPAVSFHTYVRVGSANDPAGHTGLTYLFERVSLTGTENIGSKGWTEERKALDAVENLYDSLENERNLGPKASQPRIETLQTQLRLAIDTAQRFGLPDAYRDFIEEGGGTKAAVHTTPDGSECEYSLPSNRIELWFLMESQRLMRPVFRDFYAERDTLLETVQKRDAAGPGRATNAFLAAAFEAHPYRNPVAGWPSDLANLRRTDARAFFEKYYVPGNVVMALVGDVNPAEAKRLAEKYFGAWAARPLPPQVSTQEPPQLGPRTAMLESEGRPVTVIGYKRPSVFDKDDAALDLLQIVLTQGRAGLLYKELVTDKHYAQSVRASSTFPAGRYPNSFVFILTPGPGHTVEENQRTLEEFLNRLKQQRLDPGTMDRARAQARAQFINRLSGNAGLAGMLGFYQANFGDWRKLFVNLDAYAKVTADDMQRVLIKYFVPMTRTTVSAVLPGQMTLMPAPPPEKRAGDKQ